MALLSLQSSISDITGLVDEHGSNSVWTNPYLLLWQEVGHIDDLIEQIQGSIDLVSVLY